MIGYESFGIAGRGLQPRPKRFIHKSFRITIYKEHGGRTETNLIGYESFSDKMVIDAKVFALHKIEQNHLEG